MADWGGLPTDLPPGLPDPSVAGDGPFGPSAPATRRPKTKWSHFVVRADDEADTGGEETGAGAGERAKAGGAVAEDDGVTCPPASQELMHTDTVGADRKQQISDGSCHSEHSPLASPLPRTPGEDGGEAPGPARSPRAALGTRVSVVMRGEIERADVKTDMLPAPQMDTPDLNTSDSSLGGEDLSSSDSPDKAQGPRVSDYSDSGARTRGTSGTRMSGDAKRAAKAILDAELHLFLEFSKEVQEPEREGKVEAVEDAVDERALAAGFKKLEVFAQIFLGVSWRTLTWADCKSVVKEAQRFQGQLGAHAGFNNVCTRFLLIIAPCCRAYSMDHSAGGAVTPVVPRLIPSPSQRHVVRKAYCYIPATCTTTTTLEGSSTVTVPAAVLTHKLRDEHLGVELRSKRKGRKKRSGVVMSDLIGWIQDQYGIYHSAAVDVIKQLISGGFLKPPAKIDYAPRSSAFLEFVDDMESSHVMISVFNVGQRHQGDAHASRLGSKRKKKKRRATNDRISVGSATSGKQCEDLRVAEHALAKLQLFSADAQDAKDEREKSKAAKEKNNEDAGKQKFVLRRLVNYMFFQQSSHAVETKEEEGFVCRICEERVPLSFLEQHGNLCAIRHKIDLTQFSCDARLKKLVEVISTQLHRLSLESRQKGSPPSKPLAVIRYDAGSRNEFTLTVGSAGSVDISDPLSLLNALEAVASTALSLGPDQVEACDTLAEELHDIVDDLFPDSPGPLDSDVVETVGNDELDPSVLARVILHVLEEKRAALKENEAVLLMARQHSDDNDGEEELCSFKGWRGRRSVATDVDGALSLPTIDDFDMLHALSRGAFGRVYLARKRATGDVFAVKVLKKASVIRKNLVEAIYNERNIMAITETPYVVKLYYSFHSENHLYLVMEYLHGGDLSSLLARMGRFPEPTVRLYMGDMLMALQYLHERGIIHRDIKPDNILISPTGHLKLTDFGLSHVGKIESARGNPTIRLQGQVRTKLVEGGVRFLHDSSVVGSPDYLAPEILLGLGITHAADWWALGVVLFELLTGIPPFNAPTPAEIFDHILNCCIQWDTTVPFSPAARSLVEGLLRLDPAARLTGDSLKLHPFFLNLDWPNLLEQKATFVPKPLDTVELARRRPMPGQPGGAGDVLSRAPLPSQGSKILQTIAEADVDRPGMYEEEDSGPREEDEEGGEDPFVDFGYKNLAQLEKWNASLSRQEK